MTVSLKFCSLVNKYDLAFLRDVRYPCLVFCIESFLVLNNLIQLVYFQLILRRNMPRVIGRVAYYLPCTIVNTTNSGRFSVNIFEGGRDTETLTLLIHFIEKLVFLVIL